MSFIIRTNIKIYLVSNYKQFVFSTLNNIIKYSSFSSLKIWKKKLWCKMKIIYLRYNIISNKFEYILKK